MQLSLLDLVPAKTRIYEFKEGDLVSGYRASVDGETGQLISGIICKVGHQYLRLTTGDIYRKTAVASRAKQTELL